MWKKIKQGWNEWLAEVRKDNQEFWSGLEKSRKAKFKAKSLRRAIKIADQRHASDNRTYYVLPDWQGKYHAFNRDEVQYLKRIGIFQKRLTIVDVIREAAYITKRGTN